MTKRTLTESERTTLTSGLRVAAERFQQHVVEFASVECPICLAHPLAIDCKCCNGTGAISQPPDSTYGRLASQFKTQYADSIALAELLEGAESIEVEPAKEVCEVCEGSTLFGDCVKCGGSGAVSK